MWAYKRFLKYAEIWTSSDRESKTVPSSFRQFDLAHLDTFPDICGENVKPQVIENYDGEDVPLGNSGVVLKVAEYPHLRKMKGDTLITTDGTTLLGADDKAGIAEIMTALEYVISKEVPHGPLSVAFVPDEKIGNGTDHFNVERFGAQYAYTVDGWEAGEIIYENFNAARVTVHIHGKETHTGRARGRMVNAQLVGMEMNQMLPPEEIPSMTEGRQGFYHLTHSGGDVVNAVYVYAVRDHDDERFEKRIDTLKEIGRRMNEKYGEGTVTISVKEEYRNMKSRILPCFHLVDSASKACEMAGIIPQICPARGGTVGSRLSFMGLPSPIIGAGGYAYHGVTEHITAEAMEAVARILVGIIRLYSDK